MSNQREYSLKLLAITEAAVGGLVALVVFALYGLHRSMLSDTGVSFSAAILGAAGVVYFATLHQVLKANYLSRSVFTLTLITAANLIFVIGSTGGLDSPYYSLWLLAIIVAGLFGTTQTIITLGVTLLYYVGAVLATSSGSRGAFLREHIVQLIITILAAGLAEWVHGRSRANSADEQEREVREVATQLQASQLSAEAIMGSIGEGLLVTDTARHIKLFNKTAVALTGWDESSAQNIDYNLVLQLKTAADQPLDAQTDPFAQAWKTAQPVANDNLTITSRTGRKTQINISVSPMFDDNGSPNGAIALFRDISREKEVERQKDEFISTASHEMRTPVAAIEGYISLAMNPNVATIDDRAKKYLDKAHETIGHLGDLFRDLLSVAKAEDDALSGKIGVINLGELLQDVADDMQFTVQRKNLTLVFQIGGQNGKVIAPLYYVAANSERLREVVMNLIDNAVKFTKEGGIRLTIDGDDKEVTVGVADTGMGIASEDIPHLFQKFYRIDNSATRTIGGTGLGLYLCRRIVEWLNGRIWVESKPGMGSVFRFALPRLSQDEAERMQAAAAAGPSQTAGGVVAPQDSSASVAAPALASAATPPARSDKEGEDEEASDPTAQTQAAQPQLIQPETSPAPQEEPKPQAPSVATSQAPLTPQPPTDKPAQPPQPFVPAPPPVDTIFHPTTQGPRSENQ